MVAQNLIIDRLPRTDGPGFRITHEFLAQMLGVRRVGITVAAGELQRRGLIGYHRGELEVLDRGGLEAMACSCYASDCLSYARRMDHRRRPAPAAGGALTPRLGARLRMHAASADGASLPPGGC